MVAIPRPQRPLGRTPRRLLGWTPRRLFGWAAVCIGLALAAIGFGAGVAAAAPSQPVPADIPFMPTDPTDPGAFPTDPGAFPSDPGSFMPTSSGPMGLLSNAGGGLMPLVTDTTKLLSAGSDPNAYLTDAQALLNDAGSLVGVPVGMPNVSSLVPQGAIPGAPAPLQAPGLVPPAPGLPAAPGLPLAPGMPPAPGLAPAPALAIS
jgi:hypothetical protein